MITLNDLRVGNLVQYAVQQDSGRQFFTMTAEQMVGMEVRGVNDLCKGIPITTEWLERFGFDDLYPGYEMSFMVVPDLYLRYKPDDIEEDKGIMGIEQFTEGFWMMPHLLYVHQLQNLIFALRGTEINFEQNQ